MKKLLIALFTFGYMFAFSQTATLTIPGDLNVANAGDQVVVPITIDDISQPDIGSFLISILFDGTALTFDSYQNLHPNANPSFYSDNVVNGNDYRGNWLDFIALSSFNVAVGDVLIELVFTVNADSDFTFATSKKVENNFAIKQATEMITGGFLPYALTLNNGAVTVGTVVTGSTWTGLGGDNDWDNPANWDAGGVPAGTDATIPVTGNDPFIYGSASTAMLTVAAGAQLDIDPFSSLTTSGLFTCDGTFIIWSDLAGYSGSFIDLGGLAGAGMFYMDREITCFGDGDPNNAEEPLGWHYISAPIDGVSTDDMLDFYVNEFDAVNQEWMNYAGTTPCIPYAPAETLEGMEVWSVKYDQLWPYDFTSDPCPQVTNGPVVKYSGAFTDLHTGAYGVSTEAGWNLVPNPYPSGLGMDLITWDAAAVPGGAFYDGCIGNYLYWTPATGIYDMPVGNGFFVEYTAAGSFDLTGGERSNNPDFFYKEDITSLLTLQASSATSHDQLNVRFMENAEAGFAKDGDFHKLISPTEGLPQIYTTAGADMLAINALPATNMVPMGFTSITSDEYTISAIETSEFSEVYLQDLVTGDVTDLMTSDYTFDYTTGEDANRFIIHFAPVGVGENLMNSVSIWSNESSIYVSVPKELKGTIAVYNMMGQEVVSTDTQPGTNVIPMDNTNTYYVVKVLSSDNAVTGKVYIK